MSWVIASSYSEPVLDRDALLADALQAFAVFAEHLNFTTAAAELHISQPALHVKIRKLGVSLGVELYERHGRGLVLTDAGHQLAAFGRDSRRRVEDFLTALQPASRPVTLAAGRGTLRWVIGEGIGRLIQDGRAVRALTADRETALAHVNSGRADIAVIAHDPPPAQLAQQRLVSYPQVVVATRAHRLASRRSVRLADLDGEEVVLPPPGRPHRAALEEALREAGAAWQVTAEVDGWDLLVHFVSLGMGVTVVNGCVDVPDGLVARPVLDLPAVAYWAAWRPPRQLLVSQTLALLMPSKP